MCRWEGRVGGSVLAGLGPPPFVVSRGAVPGGPSRTTPLPALAIPGPGSPWTEESAPVA